MGRVRLLFSALGVCVSFSLGYMLVPLLAFFLRDWKSLVFAVCLLNLLYLPLWWLVFTVHCCLVSKKQETKKPRNQETKL